MLLFCIAGTALPLERVDVIVFYSKTCEHCKEVIEEYFPPIFANYPGRITLQTNEIEDNLDNYERLIQMEREFGDENNEVPVVFIGDSVFGGDEVTERFLPYLTYLLGNNYHDAHSQIKVADTLSPDTTSSQPAEGEDTLQKAAQESIQTVTMAFFWEPGCQHCSRVTYDLQLLQRYHPTLVIRDFNIEEKDAKLLAEVLAYRLGVPENLHLATPTIFLPDTYFVTSQISFRAVEEAVVKLENSAFMDSVWIATEAELAQADERIRTRFQRFQILPVLGAGLIDGVNPCAFGAIIFFVTFLTVVNRKRREILMVGIAFTLSVFLTYFLVGTGFLKFMQALPFIHVIARWIYMATGVLVLALGVLSIYDFFRSRKGEFAEMTLQLPDKLKKRIHKVIISENEPRARRNIVFASITTGFFVSILEMACTGQVYLPTIIYVMGAPGLKTKAVFYLFLYNLMFIIPLIGVFAVVFFGTTSEQLTNFLKKNTPTIKLLTAGIFFAIAFFMWRTVFGS
jgi:glutaredoxin